MHVRRTARSIPSIDDAAVSVRFQAVPEGGDGVEDFAAALEKLLAREGGLEEDVFEFLKRVPGVLGFDAVVPGEKGESKVVMASLLHEHQAVFEFLPEAGGGPILDGEARAFGHLRVFVAEEALQLVAEKDRARPTEPALAEVVEAETQPLADAEQPFEMRARKRNTPPSTVPSVLTRSGSPSRSLSISAEGSRHALPAGPCLR